MDIKIYHYGKLILATDFFAAARGALEAMLKRWPDDAETFTVTFKDKPYSLLD